MVDTIVRIGYAGEDPKKRLRLRSAFVHMLGSVASGATLGFLLGKAGAWILGDSAIDHWAFCLGLGSLMVLYSVAEFGYWRLPRPQIARQVRREWVAILPGEWAALFHGLGLGWGVFTFIPFSTLYFVIAGAFVVANPLWGSVILAIFGFARGFPVLLLSIAHPAGMETDELRNKLLAVEGPVRRGNGAILLFSSVAMLMYASAEIVVRHSPR